MFIFPCHILVYHQTYRLIHMFAVLDLSRAEMNQTRHSFTYFINCFGTTHRVPIHGIYLNQLYAHFAFCLVLFSPSFFFNMLLKLFKKSPKYIDYEHNFRKHGQLFNDMCLDDKFHLSNSKTSSMLSVFANSFGWIQLLFGGTL